ncbi:MAG: M15 family metallopeptidase [Thermovirga sp.]
MLIDFYERPIPILQEEKTDEMYSREIRDCGEGLIPMSLLPEKVLVLPEYFMQGIPSSLPEAFVREGVWERVVRASRRLPEGFRFVVLDAWRAPVVQENLFEACKRKIETRFPGRSREEIVAMTRRYVALPTNDPSRPSPHATGGAVDITIADPMGRLLSMGYGFDEDVDRSMTRFFEEKVENGKPLTEKEHDSLRNRRLLFHLLADEGFCNCSDEWWHFAYGTQSWSWEKNTPYAIYGFREPDFHWG